MPVRRQCDDAATPRASRDADVFLAQHFTQGDQRQPDQGGRIAALDGFQKTDAEPFGFRAASAVDCCFLDQVALYLGGRKAPVTDRGRNDAGLFATGRRIEQGDGGVENSLLAACPGQLFYGPLDASRFVKAPAVAFSDLVGSDDEPGRVSEVAVEDR